MHYQRRLVTIITCAIVTVQQPQPLQPAESAKRVHYIWRTRPKLAFRKNRDQPPLMHYDDMADRSASAIIAI